MDYIATFLGLQRPTLRARDVLRESRYSLKSLECSRCENKFVWGKNCDRDPWDLPPKTPYDDDETASTLSDCDDSSISSSSSLGASSVSFAVPLVTEVHLRPYTPKSERQGLFYTEADFRQFRMDYRRNLCQKKPTVSFCDTVVCHTLPVVENKDEVYYSAAELRQFLEDFILSLEEKER